MGKTERLLEQAIGHLKESDYDNALRLFNQVLNREPGNREALKQKALLIIQSEDTQEAINFLHTAVERCRDDELYQILGALYLKENEPTEGLTYLLRSVEINGNNAEAHYSLGMLYGYHQDDHVKAVKHFTQSLKNKPDYADAYFNRGCSYMILHRMKEAEKDLLKAKKEGHDKAGEMLEEYF